MDNKKDLDNLTKNKLDEILSKKADVLDSGEIGFLRARRSYLTDAETEKYSSILEDTNSDHNPTVSPEMAEEVEKKTAAKKAKKTAAKK